MKLPNHANAVIPIEKLTEYCLNTEHPIGKEKAIVFRSALNIKVEDASLLKELIFEGLATANCVVKQEDHYGHRFSVSMLIRNFEKQAWVTTGWIIKAGDYKSEINKLLC